MKRHVPFTSVSVDPDIQRMRDILVNGGYMGPEGDLYNENEALTMNQNSDAKAVPKTVVSVDAEIASLGMKRGIFLLMKMEKLYQTLLYRRLV